MEHIEMWEKESTVLDRTLGNYLKAGSSRAECAGLCPFHFCTHARVEILNISSV